MASMQGGSTQLRPASPLNVKAGAPTQPPIGGVGVQQGYAAPAGQGSPARLVLQDPGPSPGVPPEPPVGASTKAPPGAPTKVPPSPPPPHHHPSPSPSPGQPLANRTEGKSSSVSSEAPAGLLEESVIPVDEPPSPLTVEQSSLTPGPGPTALAIKVDKSSYPGPLQPPNTEVDQFSLGIQGASGFTAGDTSFVTPVANPQVPLPSPRTL